MLAIHMPHNDPVDSVQRQSTMNRACEIRPARHFIAGQRMQLWIPHRPSFHIALSARSSRLNKSELVQLSKPHEKNLDLGRHAVGCDLHQLDQVPLEHLYHGRHAD